MSSAPDATADLGWDAPYQVPLAEFVATRSALVARLKNAGLRERSAEAKALAKPSATAWAVNQVHWQAPALLVALFAAGDELREAQASGHAEGLRAAMTARREALSEVRARALAFLSASGHAVTPAVEQRVSDTLLALASHGSSLPTGLRPGRLTHDLEPPGFEALAGLALAPTPGVPVPPAPPVVPPVSGVEAHALDAAHAERDHARQAHERAERDLQRAREDREQALVARDRQQAAEAALAGQIAELRARLDDLQSAFETARAAGLRAQQVLDAATAHLRAAQDEQAEQQRRHDAAESALAALTHEAGRP